jgi:alpha-beta hydrolase superfamily lysophospholipase
MSTGQALRALDDTDRRVTALEQDIGSCGCLTRGELDDWAAWRDRWRAFLRASKDRIAGLENALSAAALGGVIATAAAESYVNGELADIEEERAAAAAELGTWQQQAAARGAKLSPPRGEASTFPWITVLAFAAVSAAVAGAAYVVYVRPRTRKNPQPQQAPLFRRGTRVIYIGPLLFGERRDHRAGAIVRRDRRTGPKNLWLVKWPDRQGWYWQDELNFASAE